jgi:hypothetical protein
MANSNYPYPNYVPNKAAASCVAAVVGISLIAWLIQSIQTRFQPLRASILLLASHMAICTELILRAAVNDDRNSKTMFSILTGLFTIGVRMIIIANFSFVLEVHHEKTRLARVIFLGVIVSVLTSACLMIPANMSSFDSDGINTSFLFRKLSASVLLVVTISFYVILYWSQTIKDMTMQAIIVVMTSSTLCLTVAIVNLIESISLHYYEEINNQEGWFYGLQMIPIILAHITWSIFHPKRSLKLSETNHGTPTNEQQPLLRYDPNQ